MMPKNLEGIGARAYRRRSESRARRRFATACNDGGPILCRAIPPPCDDGFEPLYAMPPPTCEGDTILAVQHGCFECVSLITCTAKGWGP